MLNEIYSLDEKKYYIYYPGSTHYDEDKFGNPVYVPDFYYLDENFNKFIGNRSVETADKYAEELTKHGKDVFVGPCSPEIEDENGEFIPYSNPNVKGIWKRSTNVEIEIYKEILKKQQEENKTRKLA